MKSFFKLLAVVFFMTIIGCEAEELSDETTIEFQAGDQPVDKDIYESSGGQSEE